GTLLAAGVMTKVYPLVVAPLLALEHVRRRDARALVRGAAAAAGVIALVLLPFIVTDPRSLLVLYRYHAERGVHLESTYSGLLLAAAHVGRATIAPAFGFGAWNLTGPLADAFARASTIV